MNSLPQIKNHTITSKPDNVNILFALFIFCAIFGLIGIIAYLSNNIDKKIESESFINKKTIILLGDSLLNNSKYVPSGETVNDLISEKNNVTVINYAMDDSSISNVYNQLNKISIDLNDSNTFIFLSVGGNDLLKSKTFSDTFSDTDLNKLIEKYNLLVSSIESRLPFANLVLLTLFYPPNSDSDSDSNTFKTYYKYIEIWNNNIINNHKNYIDLSSLINSNDDIVENIEPSVIGGKKIASAIYTYVS